jgi:hypothetical protein
MTHAKHRWKRPTLGCSLLASFSIFIQNPAYASNDFSHLQCHRLQSEISHVTEPKESEPQVPEPSVPEPSVPEPEVPEPSVPEPEVPEPSVPEPEVPEPSVPEPENRQPGIPEGTSGDKRG